MSWIKFCKCNRRILTTGQMMQDKPCDICQEEEMQNKEDKDDRNTKVCD
jgi:hypothetical protein